MRFLIAFVIWNDLWKILGLWISSTQSAATVRNSPRFGSFHKSRGFVSVHWLDGLCNWPMQHQFNYWIQNSKCTPWQYLTLHVLFASITSNKAWMFLESEHKRATDTTKLKLDFKSERTVIGIIYQYLLSSSNGHFLFQYWVGSAKDAFFQPSDSYLGSECELRLKVCKWEWFC